MGLLSKAIGGSVNPVVTGTGYELSRGFTPGTYTHYRNDYENAYPSIRVIAQRFASIEPFTVDKQGDSVASNVLDRLYTPNQQMSAYDFREALAVMSLVHNKVYIRVHHKGVRINADSITGFTFLEGVSEHLEDGKLSYWLPNGDKRTDEDTIVLKSVNPYRLADGFSPAFAARRWTSLDDLIADYQTGFFNNGAVPAGQFVITAKTATDYKDIVAGIKAHHQGARNNNNLMFAHKPTDATGKPLDSQIEWIPFSSQNKDMALKDLFEQANKKIDSTYGVPASLRGVNDNNTYASVRVDQQIFVENTLDPFTLKVWQKFTHELNRITGGTGVAISYELDTPVVADEEKVKAEAQQVTAQTLINLTAAGYSLESVIKYVETDDISVLEQLPPEPAKPDVLDSEEASDTPDQPVDPTQPSKSTLPKAKALSDSDRAAYEQRLSDVVTARMSEQIRQAEALITSKAATPEKPVDDSENDKLAAGILAVLLGLIAAQGVIEHRSNARLVFEAGINTSNVTPFELTGAQRAMYQAYVHKVATSYNADTAERIRNILSVGRDQNLPAGDIRNQLKALLDEKWRIKRLTVTEVNKAGNEASLFSMENIARETGAEVNKVWEHSGSDAPCEFCQTLIGNTVPLHEAFVSLNQTIHGVDGGMRVNDFEPMTVAGAHPNCHCRVTYEVIK